jgi:mono/diheme cytochrome c family protein
MHSEVAAERCKIQLRADLATKENTMQNRMIWNCRLVVFATLAGALLLSAAARADNAAEGTYKAKCATCHGPDGKGDTPAGKAMKAGSFAAPEVVKMSDDDLAMVITKGKNSMPSFDGKLKKEQITQLVAYIRELAKK